MHMGSSTRGPMEIIMGARGRGETRTKSSRVSSPLLLGLSSFPLGINQENKRDYSLSDGFLAFFVFPGFLFLVFYISTNNAMVPLITFYLQLLSLLCVSNSLSTESFCLERAHITIPYFPSCFILLTPTVKQ